MVYIVVVITKGQLKSIKGVSYFLDFLIFNNNLFGSAYLCLFKHNIKFVPIFA